MATLRPAADRLRDQQRREIMGRWIVAAGALLSVAVFAALVAEFGLM